MRKYLCFALCLFSGAAHAKPDLSQPLGPTLADRGSAFYSFNQRTLDSADGQRHYRIWTATPKQAAPATGYPVLYLLDGNAALGVVQDEQLAELDRLGPPVLVFIGYATELRFDVTARAYDYTPPLPGGAPVIDDIARNRQGGGADQFLDLFEQRIKPQVEAQVKIDSQRQALWGHSYGGLLGLHALFTRPQLFQRYVLADPSIWWQNGFILDEEKAFKGPPAPLHLTLLRGMAERSRDGADALSRARQQASAAVPADAAARMGERLAEYPAMQVSYREFAELGHGAMLPASLQQALRIANGDAYNNKEH